VETILQNIANAAPIKCHFQAGAKKIEVKTGGQNGGTHLVIEVMG
jgi:hypothetical protein